MMGRMVAAVEADGAVVIVVVVVAVKGAAATNVVWLPSCSGRPHSL